MFLRFHCRFDDHIEVFPRKCVEVCRIVSLGTTQEFFLNIVMKIHNIWDFLASCITMGFSLRKLCRGVQLRSKDSQVKTQLVLCIFVLFKVTR
jgi:hypothetical protein